MFAFSGNERVIFTLNGENLTLICSKEDKMKDICQGYALIINKNIDSLLFLYEGKKINLKKSFNALAKNKNEMTISVYENQDKNNNSLNIKNYIIKIEKNSINTNKGVK